MSLIDVVYMTSISLYVCISLYAYKSPESRGFDSSGFLVSRGGIRGSTGSFPEI